MLYEYSNELAVGKKAAKEIALRPTALYLPCAVFPQAYNSPSLTTMAWWGPQLTNRGRHCRHWVGVAAAGMASFCNHTNHKSLLSYSILFGCHSSSVFHLSVIDADQQGAALQWVSFISNRCTVLEIKDPYAWIYVMCHTCYNDVETDHGEIRSTCL